MTASSPATRFQSDWLPSAMAAVFLLGTSVTNFIISVFFSEKLHFSGQQIGILFAVLAVTGVLAALPTGLGNDWFTSRTLVAVGLVLQAAGFVGLALVRPFWAYLGVVFAWGLANNLTRLSLDVQILKGGAPEAYARRLTLYQIFRFSGLTIGSVLTGLVVQWLDFELCLLVVGGICLLLAVPALRLASTPVGRTRLTEYRADLREPGVLFFAAWMFLFSSHWGAEGTSYGLFLRSDLRFSLGEMGMYMGAEYGAILAVIALLGARVARPGGMRHWACWGTLFSGIGSIGMIFPPTALSVAFRTLHGVGDGLMLLIMCLGINRLFKLERLGGNAGFITMMTMLGYVVGSLIYGPVGEHLGYRVPLWVSGTISLALVPPLLSRSAARSLGA
jgi:MFS family permease